MSPLQALILTTGISNLLLGVFVYFKQPSKANNICFGFLGISTGLWAFTNLAYQLNTTVILLKLTYALGALVPAAGAMWMLQVSHLKSKKVFTYITLLAGILFASLSLLNGYVISGEVSSGKLLEVKGQLFSLY